MSNPSGGSGGSSLPGRYSWRTSLDSAVLVVEQDEEDTIDETPVIEELLVEEVSIDGMCGVY